MNHCRLSCRNRNFQLSQDDSARIEGRRAIGYVSRCQKIICTRIDNNAIIPARGLDDNKSHSSGCVGDLPYVSDVNALVTVKRQRCFAETILSNFCDEADFRSQTRAPHCLIGSFPAKIHAIACSEKGLAAARQALNFHREPGRITADHRNFRSVQQTSLRNER